MSENRADQVLIISILAVPEERQHGILDLLDLSIVIGPWDLGLQLAEVLGQTSHELSAGSGWVLLVVDVNFFDDVVFDDEQHVRRFLTEVVLDFPKLAELADVWDLLGQGKELGVDFRRHYYLCSQFPVL